ncbi:cuticle protein 19.8-like [Panulirus ornatus]|uniref:cuticle protein 19.8-like n=1 Tax=Panulirus ornatus TaxID=150431 RepID=UPI003A866C1F
MSLITTMKVIIAMSLFAAAMAAPSYYPVPPYSPAPSYEGPAQYSFDYGVRDGASGNDFGHQESRDGYNTQGSYSVQLPDGRLQTVRYTVNGDSGYVAEVTYQGEAHHPTYRPAYTPSPAYVPSPAYTPSPAYRPITVYG